MKHATRRRLLILAVLAGLLAPATPPAAAQGARVNALAWMQGCWGLSNASGDYEELWLAPTGNSMLGISRRMAEGYTQDFEFMHIVTDGRGGIDYVAQPVGESPTRYALIQLSPGLAIFENPTESFPQRLRYEATDTGLSTRIEGVDQGQPRQLSFSLTRKDCH